MPERGSPAVLVAMGVREEDGKRRLLGVSVSLSEAEVHLRAFLEGLRKRGLEVTKLITSDDHAGRARSAFGVQRDRTRRPQREALLDDGDEHIDPDGDPDFRLQRVLGGAEERRDA